MSKLALGVVAGEAKVKHSVFGANVVSTPRVGDIEVRSGGQSRAPVFSRLDVGCKQLLVPDCSSGFSPGAA